MGQASWVDSGHVRDPNESVKAEWTEDGWHKIQGQLLLTPNFSYQEKKKMGPNGPIWGVRVPDLDTLIFNPEIEFICDIWTSNVVSKGIVNQRGEHPIKLYAAIYTPEQFSRRTMSNATPLAVYRDERNRPPCFKERGAFGITIAPDSGQYVIEWSIARNEHNGTRDRQPSGSVEGHFTWDSNSDLLRRRLTILHNI